MTESTVLPLPLGVENYEALNIQSRSIFVTPTAETVPVCFQNYMSHVKVQVEETQGGPAQNLPRPRMMDSRDF